MEVEAGTATDVDMGWAYREVLEVQKVGLDERFDGCGNREPYTDGREVKR